MFNTRLQMYNQIQQIGPWTYEHAVRIGFTVNFRVKVRVRFVVIKSHAELSIFIASHARMADDPTN